MAHAGAEAAGGGVRRVGAAVYTRLCHLTVAETMNTALANDHRTELFSV